MRWFEIDDMGQGNLISSLFTCFNKITVYGVLTATKFVSGPKIGVR